MSEGGGTRPGEERFPGELYLRLLAGSIPDILFVYRCRPERRFDFLSDTIADLTGHSPEEHYADPELIFQACHSDDRPLLADLIDSGRFPAGPLFLRWLSPMLVGAGERVPTIRRVRQA